MLLPLQLQLRCLPVAFPHWGERKLAPSVFPRHPCPLPNPCPSRQFWVRQVWTPPRKSGRARALTKCPICALPHLRDLRPKHSCRVH